MFGVGVSWVFVSMNDFGGMGVALSVAITTALVVVMAAFPALAGYVANRLCAGSSGRTVRVLAVPAAWTLFEWARGRFMSGFPWLNLGYSQIDSPLAGFAPLLGVYGVSLLAALSAALLLGAVGTRAWPRWLGALAALWLAGAGLRLVDWTQPAGEAMRVSLVQGNLSQDLKWDPSLRDVTVELYTGMTREHWDSRLIVWPETAMPMYYLQARPYLEALAEEADRHGSAVLVGLIYLDPRTDHYYNSMVSVGGGREQIYHKHHLVPFTEYLPLKGALGRLVDFFAIPMSDFTPGGRDQPPLEAAGQKLGMSICYEDAFGEEMIHALPEATLLVNVSNDAWFGRSIAPRQHLEIARMRALETGRYLVRATNTGLTAVIGPDGGLRSVAPQFERTVLTDTVVPRGGATPYVRAGNRAFLILSAALLVCAAWLRRRQRTRLRTRT
jgi:apolipoprotein N-acyltransferase